MRGFFRYNFGAIVWSALILSLLFIPTTGIEGNGIFALDKIIHVTIFAMLSYLSTTGQIKQHRFSQRKHRIAHYCLIYSVLFGVATEMVQYFLGYRSFDVFDIIANVSGAFVGFFYFQFWISKCLKSAYNFNV